VRVRKHRGAVRLALAAVTLGILAVGGVELATALRPHDYDVRVADIPMRDGVRLHTLILVPKGAANRPMLLTRTPFGAGARVRLGAAHLADAVMPVWQGGARDGDILVFQDIRGRGGSGGDFAMLQPLAAPGSARADESTDAWDSVEYLIRHVPQANGRVGLIGFSFDGFTTLAALLHPHPAITAAVAIDPLVDGWTGDDWFHHGAFRQVMIPFIRFMTGAGAAQGPDDADDYSTLLRAGSADAYARSIGLAEHPQWQALIQHPADDSFWRNQAIDQRLAAEPRSVPSLFVGSLWDQEDGYGAVHAFAAASGRAGAAGTQHLVLGPWYHRQANGDGTRTGPLSWDQDTAARFRGEILQPFLRAALNAQAGLPKLPAVTAFETGGAGGWYRYASWPPCASPCPAPAARFYLRPSGRLSAAAPEAGDAPFDAYTADPANPVPFSPRPVQVASGIGVNWSNWMLEDQRAVSQRPDVLSYISPPLDAALHVAGAPVAVLTASTSGTDADFVVKLLDIYPADGGPPGLRGYALPVSMDIFRARYRNDAAHPQALTPGQPENYRLILPAVSHVFARGHRIGLQIQSSWFPLYDRNPQTYVANIFTAPPDSYRAAAVRIFHTAAQPSTIELPARGNP